MLKRLLPLAVAGLVLVAGAGCAKDVSPAARVAGTTISDSQLNDEVSQWAHNKAAFDSAQLKALNPGTYPMSLVTVILQQRIDFTISNKEFDALHLSITSQDRDAALATLFQGDSSVAQQALAGFTKSYSTRYVDDLTKQYAVESRLGQAGYSAWRTTAYADAHISVSPRYGSWDSTTQQVVAPKGPRLAPGETTTTAASTSATG